MNKQWIDFGTINQSKNGKGFNVKIAKGLKVTITGVDFKGNEIHAELNEGDAMFVSSKEEKFERMFKGDETKIEERLSTVPEYIKYFITVPPERDENPKAGTKAVTKPATGGFVRKTK